MIDFNFISYVLIFVGNVLMTYFGKKRKRKKLSIIVLMLNSSCLKIVQNLLGVLYTTVSVIPLYNDTNFIYLLIYISM